MRDRTPAHAEAAASIAALAGSTLLEGPLDGAALLVPLARIGDAMRSYVEVPRALRAWSNGLTVDVLEAAVRALATEVETWSLPPVPIADLDDPHVAFSVRRRDEAESVVALLRSAELRRHIAIPTLPSLESALRVWDERAGQVLSRDDVGALLADRTALQPTWAEDFPGARAASVGADSPTLATDQARALLEAAGVPGDAVVTGYVTRGVHRARVEAFAARDAAFAAELAGAIVAVREAGREVSLVAFGWHRRYVGAPSTPTSEQSGARAVSEVAPLRAMADVPRALFLRAAATEGTPAVEPVAIDLGQLAPVAAEARAVASAGRLTVQVYAEADGDVTRVTLGETRVDAPDADDALRFTASVAWSGEPVALLVEGARGESFEAPIELGPSETP